MNKKKKVEYDYYFVRNREYAGALKEANEYFAEGWTLKKWKYEATTMTFIFLMQRPKDYVKPEPVEEKPEEAPAKEETTEEPSLTK